MLYSMTGFGSSSAEVLGKRFVLEIRSLNSKQLDINMRLPAPYKSQEIALRKIINQYLKRGKVDVYFTLEITGGDDLPTRFNKNLMHTYAKELKAFCETTQIPQNEILRSIIMLPNVLMSDTQVSEEESMTLQKMCAKALEKVKHYRLDEGEVLSNDFSQRIHSILTKLEKVKELEPERVPRVKKRLKQSLLKNAKDLQVDENRFEQELIFYLEKLDITEETVRLLNNCQLFLTELDKQVDSKGKKLNFISQEIGREINTIGSKANDMHIQVLVVEMKDELEKIKEQLLNVL